jgi:diaminopropionate ammonia-lyase
MTRAETGQPVAWFIQDGRSHVAAPVAERAARRAFHERLPGYAPTPLRRAERLAGDLDLRELWVKDESSRYGLPSFKILGASWGTYRALRDLAGFADDAWSTVEDLGRLVRSGSGVRRLSAATDGNHGRAVALMARWLDLDCTIFVPVGTSDDRIAAIEGEGATVNVVDGGYGDAVARSAQDASDECLVVSDTSWPGYEDIPARVVEGYMTIFDEVEDELQCLGVEEPDVVVIQVGVGALAGAATRHYRARSRSAAPRLVAVEPEGAACALASVSSGELATIPGPHPSIMVGLNCDTPSRVAWPDVSRGIDLFLAISDARAERAMRDFAVVGVVSGETGAAGLAGLRELCTGEARALRGELGLAEDATALILSTEGATDTRSYAAIVGDESELGGANG